MDRRRFIGGLATGLIAVPGCLQRGAADGPDDPTSPTTEADPSTDDDPSTTDDPPTTDDGPATSALVTEVIAVPELAAADSPDSFGVFGERDEQFLVAVFDADAETAPALDEISLETGDASVSAETDGLYNRWGLFDYGRAYLGPDEPEGWVVVRLRKPFEAGAASLNWPGGEHAIPEAVLDRLSLPPTTFEVRSFDVPDGASPGETITVEVTVENTGDADGTFVTALNRSGPWIAYTPEAAPRAAVAAGETETWAYEFTVRDEPMEEPRPMRFNLDWRGDRLSEEVTVSPEGTATPE